MTPPSGEEKAKPKPVRLLVLSVLWICILALLWKRVIWVPFHTPPGDFYKHWTIARDLLAGIDPYSGKNYMQFTYPLFTGYFYLPLGFVTRGTALWIWRILNALYILGGTALVAFFLQPHLGSGASKGEDPQPTTESDGVESKSLTGRNATLLNRVRREIARHWVTTAFLLLCLYQPVHQAAAAGNVDPLSFFFYMLFGVALARGWDKTTGLALAGATLVKVMPAVLLLPLVAARKRKASIVYVSTMATYGLLLLVTGYWKWEIQLYTSVLPHLGFLYTRISFSLHREAAMLLLPAALHDEGLFKLWTAGINLLILGCFLFVCYRWWRRKKGDGVLLVCVGILLLILLTPLLEYIHLTWIAPVLFLQIHAWSEERMNTAAFAACLYGWIMIIYIQTLNNGVSWSFIALRGNWLIVPTILYLSVVSTWGAFRSREAPEPARALERPVEGVGETA